MDLKQKPKRAGTQTGISAVASERIRKRGLFAAIALLALALSCGMLSGCQRYEPVAMLKEDPAARAREKKAEAERLKSGADAASLEAEESEMSPESTAALIDLHSEKIREPVKVKGIYLGAGAAGVPDFMDRVIKRIDETELNAVVIDVKDDYGRITYQMEGVPLVDELGAVEVRIDDMKGLLKKLKEHGIYCIARIVALKDPYIAEQKPEWALHLADGSVFRDNKGDAWVDPYQKAYWDYLADVSKAAGAAGFDEIQFDYIRFCTESGIGDVVYDEAETEGRGKIEIIGELTAYLSKALRAEGLFVSCDVFGTIIGSPVDAEAVGQDYAAMADAIDYICPMIYPSHYASGNFGLDHPDTKPYETILGALKRSKSALSLSDVKEDDENEAQTQAIVRPWLQSFTAAYLGAGNYIEYNAETTRAQIKAVYDAGYDEWILWSASANYFYDGLLSPEDAAAEAESIAASRAALPPETSPGEGGDNTSGQGASDGNGAGGGNVSDTLPAELQEALSGDDLSESDQAILEQEGALVITE